MFISLLSGNNFLERLNPTKESFDGTALLVEFWIEPEWSSSFRIFSRSPVDRDIALYSPFPVDPLFSLNILRILRTVREIDPNLLIY